MRRIAPAAAIWRRAASFPSCSNFGTGLLLAAWTEHFPRLANSPPIHLSAQPGHLLQPLRPAQSEKWDPAPGEKGSALEARQSRDRMRNWRPATAAQSEKETASGSNRSLEGA